MTRDELIEKYRDINVDGDWWHEDVYNWFEEQCKESGVIIHTTARKYQSRDGVELVKHERDISWSGFWSQGDGAAFGGEVVDFKLALECLYEDYPIFKKYLDELDGYCRMSWSVGRNNNVSVIDIQVEQIGAYLDDEHPFADVWQEKLDEELNMIESLIGDVADDLCSLLYKALQDEYDGLTSDEAVWDTIQANELNKEVA